LLLSAFSIVHGQVGKGEQFLERLVPVLVRGGIANAEAQRNSVAGLSVSRCGRSTKAFGGD
jgi:hypothetical protein